jgi:hypothetical protein
MRQPRVLWFKQEGLGGSSGSLGVARGCGKLWRAFIFALRPQLAAGAPRVRDSRNGVLENQLLLGCGFKHYRKFIETLDATEQLCAINQIDRDSASFTASEIQKSILNVLRRWL